MRFAKSSESGRGEEDSFALRISSDEGVYVLEAFGELDAGTAGLLDSAIQHGEEASARYIVVDLSGVHSVAFDVIQVLAAAGDRSRDNGHRLVMLRAPHEVHCDFEQRGLAERLPFIG